MSKQSHVVQLDGRADEARVTAFSEALSERLLTLSGNNVKFECFVRRDPERGTYDVVVRRTAHSVASDIVLGHNLFSSGEYKQLTELGALLAASPSTDSPDLKVLSHTFCVLKL